MREMLRHLVWFTVVSCFVAYAFFVVCGRLVFAQASGENAPTVIRDELEVGTHHLYGMVMVPQTCDELQEHITALSSTLYQVVFTTWQDPSVACISEMTPRAFNDTLFAPSAGVDFIATLDGATLPVAVFPVPKKSN